jgi:hypothetical protein
VTKNLNRVPYCSHDKDHCKSWKALKYIGTNNATHEEQSSNFITDSRLTTRGIMWKCPEVQSAGVDDFDRWVLMGVNEYVCDRR